MNGVQIGALTKEFTGKRTFRYLPEWVTAIKLRLIYLFFNVPALLRGNAYRAYIIHLVIPPVHSGMTAWKPEVCPPRRTGVKPAPYRLFAGK